MTNVVYPGILNHGKTTQLADMVAFNVTRGAIPIFDFFQEIEFIQPHATPYPTVLCYVWASSGSWACA